MARQRSREVNKLGPEFCCRHSALINTIAKDGKKPPPFGYPERGFWGNVTSRSRFAGNGRHPTSGQKDTQVRPQPKPCIPKGFHTPQRHCCQMQLRNKASRHLPFRMKRRLSEVTVLLSDHNDKRCQGSRVGLLKTSKHLRRLRGTKAERFDTSKIPRGLPFIPGC